MELEQSEFYRVEQIFNKSLLTVPNVHLWSTYLNYVRRRNNLTSDSSGNARQIINQTYDFVLNNIGNDKDSGPLWQDYVQFLRNGPGQIGGTSWQDQQKMDTLRKAYQRAICIPTQAVNTLWREYDSFEMGLNKMTVSREDAMRHVSIATNVHQGRKFLQEKSPSYMTARSSNTELQNLTRDLNRTTLPSLAPAVGFDGDIEYGQQVELWKQWIAWEKEDPLVLKEEDEKAYKARVIFVYKQALMALRFWPEMWCDAAEFCFANGLESEGTDFLATGATANPESCLLAFKRADRVESTINNEEGEDGLVRRGRAVRDPYDKTLDALYELIKKVNEREARAVARIKKATAERAMKQEVVENDQNGANGAIDPEAMVVAQVEALRKGNAAQIEVIRRTISFVWIALMRAMRRVQGKGKVGDPVGGSRQIFTDARGKGRITSDVYVASALIEYHCYKDPAATKIFERGMKLFKDDEIFALEYLKHLIAINDITSK
jgi:cleavage stimulation factor subunit 3